MRRVLKLFLKIVLGVVALLTTLVVLVAAWIVVPNLLPVSEEEALRREAEDLAEGIAWFEEFSENKLPSSARDIKSFREGFLDHYALVRFTVDADIAEEFARALLGEDPVLGEDPFVFRRDELDWVPDTLPEGSAGGCRRFVELQYPSCVLMSAEENGERIIWAVSWTV